MGSSSSRSSRSLTVYAFTRVFWGRAAGVLAAALVAVVPASQDILGWYGLANLAALVLLALLFCYLGSFAAAAGGASRARGLRLARDGRPVALVLLGLLAAHRLSGFVGLPSRRSSLLACLLSRVAAATAVARRRLGSPR